MWQVGKPKWEYVCTLIRPFKALGSQWSGIGTCMCMHLQSYLATELWSRLMWIPTFPRSSSLLDRLLPGYLASSHTQNLQSLVPPLAANFFPLQRQLGMENATLGP